MRNEEELTPADRELEEALGSLRPQRPAIDRDALMFRAGRVSAGRRGIFWQAASVALAACLAVSLARGPEVREVERIVRVPVAWVGTSSTTLAQLPDAPADGGYIRIRDIVLREGLDALPVSASAPGDAEDLRELRELLGQERKPATPKLKFSRFLKFIPMGA